jgi:hypothetical protein
MYTNSVNSAIGLSDKKSKTGVSTPKGYNFWERFSKMYNIFVLETEYDNLLWDIAKDINYNDSFLGYVFGSTVNYTDVAEIVNTYMKLNEDGDIPNYELRDISDLGIKKSSPEVLKNIINQTAKYSGKNAKIVERVLNQLYWTTRQNPKVNSKWLRPKTAEIINEYTTDGKEAQKDSPTSKDPFSSFGLPSWTGKALIVTAIVAVGAYGLSQVNVATSGFRKA